VRKTWWREHSLSLVLIAIFLGQSIFYWFTGLADWRREYPNGSLWPGYLTHYFSEMTVSILADTYGAVLLVLFTKWFWERGSAESNHQEPPDESVD
jgi:hypothetical protein